MRASEFPPEQMPGARYPCGNQACTRQSVWPAEELRWAPGGDDGRGTAWPPGFYCRSCQGEAPASGAGEDAPTLAEEMARRSSVAGEQVGDANLIKMKLAGTLVCILYEIPELALLRVQLVERDGEREYWPWRIPVDYDWPNSECLPGDLVSVEGQLAANGEGEPMLMVSQMRLLRQDITGEQRERLLACEDTEERWDRARRLSRA